MTNLKRLLKQPLGSVSTGLVVAFLVIAILGFADSTYLTIEHFRGVVPPCSIVAGCEKVLTSEYAAFYGIPTALFGSIFYLVMALGAFMYLESRYATGSVSPQRAAIFKWALFGTAIGFLMSLWFLYVQAFILESYCQYCLVSALTSTLLYAIAMYILSKNLSKNENV